MAKQELKRQTTQYHTPEGQALKNEASLTYDDSILPSPQELEAYKQVDARIVDFLLETAQKEQSFRHDIEHRKIELVRNADRGNRLMDGLGMFFALLALLALIGVTSYALYLNNPWFAGFFGSGTIVAIVSVFIRRGKVHDKIEKRN